MWPFRKKAEPVSDISFHTLYMEGDAILKKYYHHLNNFYKYSHQKNNIIDSGTNINKLLGVKHETDEAINFYKSSVSDNYFYLKNGRLTFEFPDDFEANFMEVKDKAADS